MLAKPKYSWRFVTAAPPREIFASMEQLIGSSPYRYEVTGDDSARVIEYSRRGFFGQWSKPRVAIRWVSCRAWLGPVGTRVEIVASSAGGLVFLALGKLDRGPQTRAVQMVRLLTSGAHDARTIYRDRMIPLGPVTLVASWAGMRYRLFSEPRYDAPRGAEILTASELQAIPGGNGPFVRVRVGDGTEGYVERDQIVAAPGVSTREAQLESARFV
jgi:hypothetical protein